MFKGAKLTAMRDAEQCPDAIAVVSVDCLPAWMTPAFGCTWVAMPNLDALAGKGVVFDRVLATSDDANDTLASLAGSSSTDAPGTGLLLLAAAAERGHATALVTDDTELAQATHRPTEVRLVAPAHETAPAASAASTNLGRLFEAAAAVAAGGDQRLIWCHASSLGAAWDAPVGFRDRYVDPDDPPPPSGTRVPTMRIGPDADPDILVAIRHAFAGQLTLFDHCLGTLLTAIAARPERWTVLVAGTCGLGLGLHGAVGHTPMLPYSEVMQLPAILVDHRERMAGQRYGGLLTPHDLGATLLDLIGSRPEPSPDSRHGRSLSNLLDSWQGPDRDRVIARSALGAAVATPSWHLVQPTGDAVPLPPARLFAKPDDFFEACDVADRCPAVADELSALAQGDLQQGWTIPLTHEAVHGA
jgi:hypothetical protein